MRKKLFTKSNKFLKEVLRVIPLASQTFSKSYLQYIKGEAPLFAARAKGAYIWDIDGNRYLDMINGLLPVILGYQYKVVDEAIKKQLKKGIIFSLASPLEFELAKLLKKHIPCAEMVRFGKNGSDATTGAIRLARAVTGRDHVATCYDEETEILTKDGFKRFGDLKDDEIVATLNPDNGFLEYKKIEKKVKYHFSGKMVHFKGNRVDLMVTPDHKVYRKFPLKKGFHFKLVEARSALMRKSITQMTSVCEWKGESKDKVFIPTIANQTRPTKALISFPTKEFTTFMGWYLSEGCCITQKRGRYEILISQDKKNISKSAEIISLIQKLGFRPYKNGHHICFNSKELVFYLKQFGLTKKKFIPDWIKNLPPEHLAFFADAMIKGDGTFYKGKMKRFYSTSPDLIDGMQEVLLKLGYSTTVSKYKGNGFSGGVIYHLNISRERVLGCFAKGEFYNGYVYCVTVPNHIILVKRNGKIAWSGNCGYHGWHDWYIGTTTRDLGVPEDTKKLSHKFIYNDISSLEKVFSENRGKIAAVIMEPENYEAPKDNFLEKVKEVCHCHGALLIFDEVITGFRWGLGGAQKYYGVTPDLACFGKSMANGMPISALVGKKEYMEKIADIFYSFTQGGEALSIVAAIATIKELEKKNIIAHIWKIGEILQDGTNELLKKNGLAEFIKVKGKPCWQVFSISGAYNYSDLEIKTYLQQEILQAGFLWYGQHNMSFAHSKKDIENLLKAYAKIFPRMRKLLTEKQLCENIKGGLITNVFKVR